MSAESRVATDAINRVCTIVKSQKSLYSLFLVPNPQSPIPNPQLGDT